METQDRERDKEALDQIAALLYGASGIDFRRYKRATIERRARRRMQRGRLDDLAAYARRLETDRTELNALVDDVLILTTGFFRDRAAFDALRTEVLPRILARHAGDDPIRVWSAGCSTGEETYSIAILLLEYLRERGRRTPIVVFGTDVSDPALRKAREGLYPARIATAVSPERLNHFFKKCEGGYRVGKRIREICTFARHDLTRDPPFSHLDLILCRNVLIYMESPLQRDVLARLHWALKRGGFLMLGTAEAIAGYSEVFSVVDKKHCIFVNDVTPAADAVLSQPPDHPSTTPSLERHALVNGRHFADKARRTLRQRGGPPAVMVDGSLQITRLYGRTGRYLAPPAGDPSWNVFTMLREGLREGVRSAVDSARMTKGPVRCGPFELKRNGACLFVSCEVVPLSEEEGAPLLVVFHEASARQCGILAPGRVAPVTIETSRLSRC